jgi:hypothetical protein
MRKMRGLFGRLFGSAVILLFHGIAVANPVALGFPTGVGGAPATGGDPMFTFTFSGLGVSGNGIVDAKSLGGGIYDATIGQVSVTSSGDGFVGTVPLFFDPIGSNTATSASGYFYYDNLLFPGSDPQVDLSGLLFSSSPAFEINLFADGPGVYQYYDNSGYNQYIDFKLAAIPVPKAVWAGLGLLGAIGAFRLMRKQVESALV